MNILRGLALVGTILFSGGVYAAKRLDGDTKHWKTYRVEVGAHIVQFTIPPGESKDLPPFEIPSRIDLTREGTFDQALMGPRLLQRGWDYRESRFSHVDGSLTARIGLRRSEKPLNDAAALQEAVKESSRLFAMKRYLESGLTGQSDNPNGFSPTVVGGRNAWRVSYEMSPPALVVALDETYYLNITLLYGGMTDPKSGAAAKAAAAAILDSIRIEDAGKVSGR